MSAPRILVTTYAAAPFFLNVYRYPDGLGVSRSPCATRPAAAAQAALLRRVGGPACAYRLRVTMKPGRREA